MAEKLGGPVNHPTHYNAHPSGIECIKVVEWFSFNVGNAIKYLWRAGLKNDGGKSHRDATIQDLKKARQYIDFEITRMEVTQEQGKTNG